MRNMLLVLAATAAALAAGELLVRWLGAAPEVGIIRKGRFQLSDNPRIVFEPVPGMRYEGDEFLFYEYRGTANRLGYRDRDHPETKPPGVYRIAVLGDSIAAGFRIPDYEDTFPALLERLLGERGLDIEVLNFGVSGYNTEQAVETLRARALAYEPDLVLLAYCLNDRRPPDPRIVAALAREAESRGLVNPHRIGGLLAASALFRLVSYRLGGLGAEPAAPSAGEAPPGQIPADDERVADALYELGLLSDEHGFEVLVAVFPHFTHLYRYRHGDHHRRMADLAGANGFRLLDLLEPYRACRAAAPGEELAFDRYHPTAYGHRCAAEAMAGFLLEEVLRASTSADRS